MTDHNNKTDESVSAWRHFAAGILDLRFQRNLTMQLLPLFYLVLLLGAGGVILLAVALAWWLWPIAGVIATLIAPVAFLAAVAVIRAALEYLVMAYRIMETVNRMDRIPSQVDNLNGRVDYITQEFDEIRSDVDHIRREFDELAETVRLLRPVLRPFTLPGRIAQSYNKRHQDR